MEYETLLTVGLAVVIGAQLLLGLRNIADERSEQHAERVREGMRACERNPEIWPRISALAIVPWSLRLPWFRHMARRVTRLGFREIGCKVEETPTHSLASRVFYAERHRTYAIMFSYLGAPCVVFVSGLDDGSIVNTGCTDRDEGRFGELLDLGVSGGPEDGLAKHLDGVARWSRERNAAPSRAEGTMEESAALGRRYYVARFRPEHPTVEEDSSERRRPERDALPSE